MKSMLVKVLLPALLGTGAAIAPATLAAQETDGPVATNQGQLSGATAAPASLAELTSGRACLPAMTNVQARKRQSLDGTWQYLLDALGEINRRPEKTRTAVFEDVSDDDIGPEVIKEYDWDKAPLIRVPGAWNVQDEALTWYDQWMWMKRPFTTAKASGERQFLYFEAANYETVIYLNGQRIGENKGGFTPFCFEVSQVLKEGENTLIVGVNAEQDETTIPPKRADWSNYGGITRPVHLVHVPQTFVSNYRVGLSQSGDAIEFSAQLDGADAGKSVRLHIPQLGIDRSFTGNGEGRIAASMPVPGPLQRWSPENPQLYDVHVASTGETIVDRIGFRTIATTADGDILLNGEPVWLRGISMHEETLGSTPDRYMTKAAAEAQLREIKYGLNGNFVRLAHYPHAETVLRAADELGLLVWSEIPVYWDVGFDDPQILSLARSMQAENIYRDANRAAIVIWSVANETITSEARDDFLRQLVADVRELDSTRLVSMASHTLRSRGGAIEFDDPVIGDIDLVSVNYYRGWYSDTPLWDLANIEWANNSGKPLIFSEYGAGALAGFHSDENRKFSEEFQAAYYLAMFDMLEKIPTLRGSAPWLLKDFRSPRRFHPEYQDGWNRKGVIAPDGRRKLAFDVLAEWYRQRAEAE